MDMDFYSLCMTDDYVRLLVAYIDLSSLYKTLEDFAVICPWFFSLQLSKALLNVFVSFGYCPFSICLH